jgi:hypothetical protein
MEVKVSVPKAMAQPLEAFIKSEGLPFVAVTDGGGAVKVVQSEAGRESTQTELHAGGSITCGLARDMAGKLGIKTREIGKLLNHLDIKIRACELGCFE